MLLVLLVAACSGCPDPIESGVITHPDGSVTSSTQITRCD